MTRDTKNRLSTMLRLGNLAALMLLTTCASSAQPSRSGNLTVEIIEFSGGKGVVQVALWRDENTFLKGQPYRGASVEMIEGRATAIFDDLEPGEYAVNAFHETYNNGTLDKNVVGKPTEPYGFSNDARRTFGPAKYQDARFEVSGSGRTSVIHLK